MYGITSLPGKQADVHTLLRLTREHWGIDEPRVPRPGCDHGGGRRPRPHGIRPMFLSTLRNTALNLLRASGVPNIAAALRHHAAHSREALALIHSKDDY
jgi:hypothetical protein